MTTIDEPRHLLRLMTDERYQLLVAGDQSVLLEKAEDQTLPEATLWVYRFYDPSWLN